MINVYLQLSCLEVDMVSSELEFSCTVHLFGCDYVTSGLFAKFCYSGWKPPFAC